MSELRRHADGVTILAITHRRSVIGPDDEIIALGEGPAAQENDYEDAAAGQDRI